LQADQDSAGNPFRKPAGRENGVTREDAKLGLCESGYVRSREREVVRWQGGAKPRTREYEKAEAGDGENTTL